MIEINRLTKTYFGSDQAPPVHALSSVGLTINRGEFVCVLGPSGCGKTTLLKCVAGLQEWDSGEIWEDGLPVTGPSPSRAVVFQGFALLPWATVLDNVAFGLEMMGADKRRCYDRAREMINLVGLDGFESRWPRELSGGMQQRVGLARALAVDPDILLMDEPFGALDEQTRRLMQEELLAIWERTDKTVLFVTHSMEEAVRLADRIVLMSPRPGSIDEILTVPLGRPRTESVLASKEFQATVEYLWSRLKLMHQEVNQGSGDGFSSGNV